MPSMKPNQRVWSEQDRVAEWTRSSDEERNIARKKLKESREKLKSAGTDSFFLEWADNAAKSGFAAAKRAQKYKGYAEEWRKRKLKRAVEKAME